MPHLLPFGSLLFVSRPHTFSRVVRTCGPETRLTPRVPDRVSSPAGFLSCGVERAVSVLGGLESESTVPRGFCGRLCADVERISSNPHCGERSISAPFRGSCLLDPVPWANPVVSLHV